jgi:murein DD-endopeptidase MepM/ murein hydrolase activator NlpD
MPGINKFASPIVVNHSVTQEFAEGGHRGIDLGIGTGNAVVARGAGVVSRMGRCSLCTAERPNFRSQGISDHSPTALRQEAWGFGFGNFVVVRYSWQSLPDAIQAEMAHRQLANGFAYVILAHLQSIDNAINVGTAVADGAPLGLSGNTGNSTGPHLHLEVRISLNGNAVSTGRFPSVNPRIMYQFP